MKIRFLFVLCSLLTAMGFCQNDLSEVEADLQKTIATFFDGMRTSDSAMVRSVCHPKVTLHTTKMDESGNTSLQEGDMEKFIVAVGSPK